MDPLDTQQYGHQVYEHAVYEHATVLGMDVEEDAEYLWLAEEALNAELPSEWEPRISDAPDTAGHTYYYNDRTGESTWIHPVDAEYRERFQRMKAEHADRLRNHGSNVVGLSSTVDSRLAGSAIAIGAAFSPPTGPRRHLADSGIDYGSLGLQYGSPGSAISEVDTSGRGLDTSGVVASPQVLRTSEPAPPSSTSTSAPAASEAASGAPSGVASGQPIQAVLPSKPAVSSGISSAVGAASALPSTATAASLSSSSSVAAVAAASALASSRSSASSTSKLAAAKLDFGIDLSGDFDDDDVDGIFPSDSDTSGAAAGGGRRDAGAGGGTRRAVGVGPAAHAVAVPAAQAAPVATPALLAASSALSPLVGIDDTAAAAGTVRPVTRPALLPSSSPASEAHSGGFASAVGGASGSSSTTRSADTHAGSAGGDESLETNHGGATANDATVSMDNEADDDSDTGAGVDEGDHVGSYSVQELRMHLRAALQRESAGRSRAEAMSLQLEKAHAAVSAFKARCEESETKCAEFAETVMALDDENGGLKSQLESALARSARQNSTGEAAASAGDVAGVESTQQQIAVLEDALQELRSRITTEHETATAAEAALAAAKQRVSALETEIDGYKSRLGTVEGSQSRHMRSLEDTLQTVSKEKAEFESKYNAESAARMKLVAEKESTVAALKAEIESVKTGFRSDIAALRKALDAAQTEGDEVKQQLDATRSELTSKIDSVTKQSELSLEAAVDASRTALRALQDENISKISAIEAQHAAAVKELQDRHAALVADSDAVVKQKHAHRIEAEATARAEAATLKGQCDALTDQVSQLTQQLTDEKQKAVDAEARIDAVRLEFAAMHAEALNQLQATSRASLNAAHASVDALQTELAGVKSQLESEQRDRLQAKTAIVELEEKLAAARAEISSSNTRIEQLKTLLTLLQDADRHAQLEAAIAVRDASVSDLNHQLERAKSDLQANTASAEALLELHKAEAQQALHTALAAAASAADDRWNAEIARVTREAVQGKADAEARALQLTAEVQRLQDSLSVTSASELKLRREVTEVRTAKSELAELLSAARVDIASLQQRLQNSESMRADAESKQRNFVERLADMQASRYGGGGSAALQSLSSSRVTGRGYTSPTPSDAAAPSSFGGGFIPAAPYSSSTNISRMRTSSSEPALGRSSSTYSHSAAPHMHASTATSVAHTHGSAAVAATIRAVNSGDETLIAATRHFSGLSATTASILAELGIGIHTSRKSAPTSASPAAENDGIGGLGVAPAPADSAKATDVLDDLPSPLKLAHPAATADAPDVHRPAAYSPATAQHADDGMADNRASADVATPASTPPHSRANIQQRDDAAGGTGSAPPDVAADDDGDGDGAAASSPALSLSQLHPSAAATSAAPAPLAAAAAWAPTMTSTSVTAAQPPQPASQPTAASFSYSYPSASPWPSTPPIPPPTRSRISLNLQSPSLRAKAAAYGHVSASTAGAGAVS